MRSFQASSSGGRVVKGASKKGQLSREVVLCDKIVRRIDPKRDPEYRNIEESNFIDVYSYYFALVDESRDHRRWYTRNDRYVA